MLLVNVGEKGTVVDVWSKGSAKGNETNISVVCARSQTTQQVMNGNAAHIEVDIHIATTSDLVGHRHL